MTEGPTLIEQLRQVAAELDEDLGETTALLIEAADNLEEWDMAFQLYRRANRRGIELYNAAHPGTEHTLPDQGRMIDWLVDEAGRKEVALKRIQTLATDEAREWVARGRPLVILDVIAKLAGEALKQTGQD